MKKREPVTETPEHREKLALRRGSCSIWRGAFAGAVGGLAGCIGMDLVSRLWTLASRGEIDGRTEELSQQGGRPEVEAAKKAGLDAGDPGAVATTVIADRVAQSQQKPLSREERRRAGKAVHYSYGIAMGALYGAGVEQIPWLRTQRGGPYGLLLWSGAEVAVPLLGLASRPTKYTAGEHLFSAVSHAVYGCAAETTRKLIRPLVGREA